MKLLAAQDHPERRAYGQLAAKLNGGFAVLHLTGTMALPHLLRPPRLRVLFALNLLVFVPASPPSPPPRASTEYY